MDGWIDQGACDWSKRSALACDAQVEKVNKFTGHLVDDLRAALKGLTEKAAKETTEAGKKLLLTVGVVGWSTLRASNVNH